LIRWLIIVGGLCSSLATAQDSAQRIPRQKFAATGAIEGLFQNDQRLGLGNVAVTIRNLQTSDMVLVRTTGDGIFRVQNVKPGRYSVRAVLEDYRTFLRSDLVVRAGELVNLEVILLSTSSPVRKRIPAEQPKKSYRKLIERQDSTIEGIPDGVIPPEEEVFTKYPNRWKFDWPEYRRYGPRDEQPYIPPSLIDPFNRNKLKGDYPIIGQRTFLNINLVSDTFTDGRRIPIPSGLGSDRPDSQQFFGKFGQFVMSENMSFSASLFHGDAAFRPVDWQIRFTPELNLNFIKVRENGIVNPDVRFGTTRFDSHLGLQEGFVEAKIKDLSNNYDFVSARVGIQTFNSDFRGFIFFDQEPGARIFGNLRNNRYQYNAAYFAMLEKDTNSGLNTFQYRNQQVFIANIYRQDFIKPGYTIQTSFHYNKDDPSFQFDTNNFLVRPAPVGTFKTHAIRAYYYGLTGDGHIGRLNINHAFYQVLGTDKGNPIASQYDPVKAKQDINAQMAAVELSLDRDWIRYRLSFFYASGDKDPRDGTARGFDTIFDNPNFNGGFFSFWNREGIRLTGSGVGLVQGSSIIPSLRSSKIEGQANFVNPGLIEYNASTDVEITPKLRGIVNLNLIRFVHPEPMDLILFQTGIHSGVGADSGLGLTYRPPLSDNIVLTGVFNAFFPFRGFKDIYNGSTLFSVAANVRFRF
jgi:Carboxypeptidase regulatory-like domain